MDDQDNYPYDNVEFPVRRPTTPGSGAGGGTATGIIGSSVSASPRIIVHPTPQEKQTPSLAPVIEMEGAEFEGEEKSQGTTTSTTSSVSRTGLLYTQTSNVSNRQTSQSSTMMSQQSSGATFGGKQTGAATVTTTGHAIPPTQQITLKKEPEKTDKVVVITKQPELVTWPFEPSDLNTVSQGVLENAYRDQATYNKLYAAMIEQGHALQKPLYDTKSKVRDRLSYEQLLQGMLFDGERLLLSGHWIYFTRLDYLDESGKDETHTSLGSGRACLTNRRLLILVADNNTEATLMPFGDPKKLPGGYELSLTQKDDIFYQSLPLSLFSSVEMDVSVGTKSRTKIQAQRPCLANVCCCCFGPSKTTWKSTSPQTHSFNRRTISLGATLPPWKQPTLLVLHLHPDLPLTLARDFVAFIQSHAQQLH